MGSIDRSGRNNSSSGTNSHSQSHFMVKEHFSYNDGGNNDSHNTSQNNISGHHMTPYMPQPVVNFEIVDHEVLKKQDYVVSAHPRICKKMVTWLHRLILFLIHFGVLEDRNLPSSTHFSLYYDKFDDISP